MNNSELRELGKTKTYSEIAEIAGKEPTNMRKYLSRHGIKYLIKKYNKPEAIDNGVIKSRIRKGTKSFEYFLFVSNENGKIIYNDWYTLAEFESDKVKECTILASCLGARIKQIVKGESQYKTFWEAVTAPSKYEKNDEYESDPLFYSLFKLMRPGSMANTVR